MVSEELLLPNLVFMKACGKMVCQLVSELLLINIPTITKELFLSKKQIQQFCVTVKVLTTEKVIQSRVHMVRVILK